MAIVINFFWNITFPWEEVSSVKCQCNFHFHSRSNATILHPSPTLGWGCHADASAISSILSFIRLCARCSLRHTPLCDLMRLDLPRQSCVGIGHNPPGWVGLPAALRGTEPVLALDPHPESLHTLSTATQNPSTHSLKPGGRTHRHHNTPSHIQRDCNEGTRQGNSAISSICSDGAAHHTSRPPSYLPLVNPIVLLVQYFPSPPSPEAQWFTALSATWTILCLTGILLQWLIMFCEPHTCSLARMLMPQLAHWSGC